VRRVRRAGSGHADWLAELLDADEDTVPPAALEGLAGTIPLPLLPRRGMSSVGGGGPVTGLTIGTVVVGYDGSPPSEPALERAATLLALGRAVVVAASQSLGRRGVVSEESLDALPAACAPSLRSIDKPFSTIPRR
jgi:hypothetical protein